ncbi:uncharacterized protein LOC126905683 isoform X4 [Daktulosphaira vitifoliae]|uniref:uncharacterized protein LOC126905683 isoform X4 n=1 Tax=Daktulosphaira vitifoliae TaxID=58002 RepID=UPI0021A979A7|nr:uncharacterized protein LOC126905683 isoform X4 [Daktulosphaira vitifoliae]
MCTTSGGDANNQNTMQENSVTTVYNGDQTMNDHLRLSPSTSSNGDSGLDNSNTSSSAGDAKLIIDVPDFSKDLESPRTGIDNPSFETDKSDLPKPHTNGVNGHNGTVQQENGKLDKEKMAEAVNLELINMKPFGKNMNGNGISVPSKKKKETAVNMNDSYDDYFIPVNEHKKYIRGGEKLYVTKDKRDLNQSKKPFICWVFGLILLAAAVIVAILASTGVIFNNETAVESRNFPDNERIAGIGNHPIQFSSVSPPPNSNGHIPFSPPTTDMSTLYVPRAIQGVIAIDNMDFTPSLANKSSPEFKTLASSIESELKRALFEKEIFNTDSDAIHVKVIEFARGSVVAIYRIGWENNDGDMPDPITVESLKDRLDSHLRESDGFLYNYRIPVHRLHSEHVTDRCKTDNAKCSHYCTYDYLKLDFVCSCPSELILAENLRDCRRKSATDFVGDMDDVNLSDTKVDVSSDQDNHSSSEPKPEPKSEPEPETKSEPEPETKSEPESNDEHKLEEELHSLPEVNAEPEPSATPETKAEPEPSSLSEVNAEPEPETKSEPEPNVEQNLEEEPYSSPEVNAEPEPSSTTETKPEPEPSSSPEVNAEPEPSSTPETKAEPEPSSIPETKAEPEPSSSLEVNAEPEPSSTPETKTEPEPSSSPEVNAGPERTSSSSDVKIEPEPAPKANIEPNSNAEPEPNSEPETSSKPETSLTQEIEKKPEPNSSSYVKVEPEPSSTSESKAEPELSSLSEVNAEPVPSITSTFVSSSISDVKIQQTPNKVSENFESLSDVDISSDNNPSDDNDKSTLKNPQVSDIGSFDREGKAHSNNEFHHEIKPEITYTISTESELETKTESMNNENNKNNESKWPSSEESLSHESEETTTISSITDNWLTSSQSSILSLPKLPQDLELSERENEPTKEEIKSESEIGKNLQEESVTKLGEINASTTIIDTELSSIPSEKIQPLSIDKNTSNDQTVPENVNINMSLQSTMDNEDNSAEEIKDQNLDDSLMQKSDSKKKDKKTSKNPEFYTSENGFMKRNKTKTEKENKKAKIDYMLEMMSKSGKCSEGQLQCTNGTTLDGSYCISESLKCDSNNDCSDYSDEEDCLENYCFQNFQCKSGECLKRSLVCDGINDCEDGSDEETCETWKCREGENQCTGGQCLPKSYFCDGKSHCNDHSDELDCNNTCNGYQCSNGYCIKEELRCNGVSECPNGEDEQMCVCFADQFKCNSGSNCISKTQVCDGIAQCSDQSDEWQCIQLDESKLMAKKESEIALEVCNTNWSNEWSDFVCHSLGFSESKQINSQNKPSETLSLRLKLKDGISLDSTKKLTDFLEQTETPCDGIVEIKCSTKHLCGDFGGKDPHSMEIWPSVTYLHNIKNHKACTASLVKRDWLLSSYSCLHSIDQSLSVDQWEAVASKTRLSSDSNTIKRAVVNIVSHPGVKFEKLRFLNDTVLVKLVSPYNLSDEVNTVCLPDKMADDKQPCVTASWAYESPGVFKQFSRNLVEPLMSSSVCNTSKYFNGFLTDREICVDSKETESTHMEIGGPLMCLAENGLWQLQGTLSYNDNRGRLSKPLIYNTIFDSVQWIEYTIMSGKA